MNRLFFAFALVLAVAIPASAQQLKLDIKDGRVTLEATGVPAKQILAEWARVGGTKVVGADKMTGGPVTLRLVDMPERQALDIVLRNVAAFMAAPRQVSSAPGASAYDRILILATTTPGSPATTTNSRAGQSPANNLAGRRPAPRPPNLPPPPAEAVEDEDEVEQQEDQADTGVPQQPVFTFPSPQGGQQSGPVFMPVPNGAGGRPGMVTSPVITLQPNANGQPTIYNFVPTGEAPPAGAPGQPVFGVIGSPTPGMIQQPQPQPQQIPPGQQRPPGR